MITYLSFNGNGFKRELKNHLQSHAPTAFRRSVSRTVALRS